MREREFSHLNMENIQKAIEGDTDVMNHELGKIFNERLKSNIFSFNRIRERRERRN
jgi:predicted nucleotidyltransferase